MGQLMGSGIWGQSGGAKALRLLYVQQVALVGASLLQVCCERLILWTARPGGQTGCTRK